MDGAASEPVGGRSKEWGPGRLAANRVGAGTTTVTINAPGAITDATSSNSAGTENPATASIGTTRTPPALAALTIEARSSVVNISNPYVLARIDPDVAAAWADEKVVRRRGRLFPPRNAARQALPVSDERVQRLLQNAAWAATARQRWQSLSWFMSIAILDDEAPLAMSASTDLNPLAPGLAAAPEAGDHTSVRQRVERVATQGRVAAVRREFYSLLIRRRSRAGWPRCSRGWVAMPTAGRRGG